jgi:hypothetical protein
MEKGYPSSEASTRWKASNIDIEVADFISQFPCSAETGLDCQFNIKGMLKMLKDNIKTDVTRVEQYEEGFSKKVVDEVTAGVFNECFAKGFSTLTETSLKMVVYAAMANFELFPFRKGQGSNTVLSVPISHFIRK